VHGQPVARAMALLQLGITVRVARVVSARRVPATGYRYAEPATQGTMHSTHGRVLGKVCLGAVAGMSLSHGRVSAKTLIMSVFSPQGCLVVYLWAGQFKATLQGLMAADFTALLAGLLILFMGREAVLNGRHIRLPLVFCLIYGILVGSLLLSSTYTIAPIDPVKIKLFRLVVVDGLAVMATLFLVTDTEKMETFMRAQIVIGLVLSLFTIVGAAPGQFHLRGVGGSSYISGGRAISLALGVSIGMLGLGTVPKQAVALMLVMGLLIMSARGPLIASFMSLVALMLYRSRRLKRPSISALAGLLVGVYVVRRLYAQGYFYTIGRRLALTAGVEDTSLAARVHFARAAEDMFLQKPALGWGLASFPFFAGTVSTEGTPHNLALELLCEVGIMGFVPFVLMMIIAAYRFFVSRKEVPLAVSDGTIYAFVFWAATIPALDLRDARAFFSFLAMINAVFTHGPRNGQPRSHTRIRV